MTDGSINGGNVAKPMLFQPLAIRGLTLKNRLVVPPMAIIAANPEIPAAHFMSSIWAVMRWAASASSSSR